MPGKILVLDDERDYALMLQELLVQNRYLADVSNRPEDALKMLEEEEYTLVISDFKMPGMDGAEFLQRARARLPHLPFIIVSGLMNTPELVKVANMGVTLVLEKPLDTHAFLRHVRRFVEPASDTEVKGPEEEAESQRTYPQPLAHLSDLSLVTQRFVQQLWKLVQKRRVFWIAAHPAAETDLVLREISAWKGVPDHRFTLIDATQLADAEYAAAFEAGARAPGPAVLGVSGLDEAPPEALRLLHNVMLRESQRPGGVLLVGFFDPHAMEPLSERHAELEALARAAMATLPPLRTRVGDMAEYFQRMLTHWTTTEQRPAKPHFEPEAVGVLLNCAWPGDYRQLVETTRLLVKSGINPVKLADVRNILVRHGGGVPPSSQGYTLEAFLTVRQREIIAEAARNSGVDVSEVLASLKIPGLTQDTPVTELKLLFPELLKP